MSLSRVLAVHMARFAFNLFLSFVDILATNTERQKRANLTTIVITQLDMLGHTNCYTVMLSKNSFRTKSIVAIPVITYTLDLETEK